MGAASVNTSPAKDRAGIAREMKLRHPGGFPSPWRSHGAVATVALVLALVLAWGYAMVGISPSRFVEGIARLGAIALLMLPPDTGGWAKFLVYVHALAETIAIALLGTLAAALLAFPAGLIAARNVVASRIVHFASRRILDCVRGVDELIWALVWINVVGLGPFAGVLAVATANAGIFGKLFSEAIEAASRGPVEGVLSTGGSSGHAVRFGLLPQVVPVLLSQVLYYFESNTRSATIIGIVGAGGIGLHLSEQIRILEYQHVSAIILMILVAVAVIDRLSALLRLSIVGARPAMRG
jgi:phosphonate transport system permease protein